MDGSDGFRIGYGLGRFHSRLVIYGGAFDFCDWWRSVLAIVGSLDSS